MIEAVGSGVDAKAQQDMELVQRLRRYAELPVEDRADLARVTDEREAADELDRLQREVDRLQAMEQRAKNLPVGMVFADAAARYILEGDQ